MESDGDLETDSIELFSFALQPIEFKLHISLVMEIQELLSSLNNLTSKLENIEKSDFIKTLNETSGIMNSSSKKIIA
jgi:hypothetical protein